MRRYESLVSFKREQWRLHLNSHPRSSDTSETGHIYLKFRLRQILLVSPHPLMRRSCGGAARVWGISKSKRGCRSLKFFAQSV